MSRHVALVAVLALGCTSTPMICVPGSTQMCLCPDLSNSAQVCAEDGSRWQVCLCAGVDAGGGGGMDSGVPGDAGPPGPTVTCSPPGPADLATLDEGPPSAATSADLVYFAGGALASLDGVSCTLAADQTGGGGALCFDRYDCGACTIEISYFEGGARSMVGDCPMYMGAYSLCELTTTCDGRECGMDSCGRSCGPSCPSGQFCDNGTCGAIPCPRGCMQGAVCCGPPFCAGMCVGTPCC